MDIEIYPERIVQGVRVALRAGPYSHKEYDYRWEFPEVVAQYISPGDTLAECFLETAQLQPGAYKITVSAVPKAAKSERQRAQAVLESQGEVHDFFIAIEPAPITAQQVEGMMARAENMVDRLSARFSQEPPLVRVSLQRRLPDETRSDLSLGLWQAIRNRTDALAFVRYRDFIDRVMCRDANELGHGEERERAKTAERRETIVSEFHGVDAYNLLRAATEAFLVLQAGAFVEPLQVGGIADLPIDPDETSRLGRVEQLKQIRERLSKYLGAGLPYLNRIWEALDDQPTDGYPDCIYRCESRFDLPLIRAQGLRCPLLLELIWSYWHEEGMLVQTINAISLRFQNRRSSKELDPLANLEIDPLRPLNNVLWGYVQDEYRRLTVPRRASEYAHEYGLALYGKAVPEMRVADNRSKFIEAFHNLLYLATVFYKQADDTTVNADPFPLLNALREVHLILAQGAHNQFGDLPWTARAEMLMQQWLLARRETNAFLRGRVMVPYEEPWMGPVDTMKSLQGWTDTSVSQFQRLARFGEQLLLSIRYTDWVGINDPEPARDWALYWRPEIQSYIHAYRAATSVDLTADSAATQPTELRYKLPSELLRQRLAENSNGHNGRATPLLTQQQPNQVVPLHKTLRERKAERK